MNRRFGTGVERAILIAFILSGSSTIIYEITLTRQVELAMGATVEVASTVLAMLLLGFTVGSYWQRKVAKNQKLVLIRLAQFELLIGLLIGASLIIVPLILKPLAINLPAAFAVPLLSIVTLPAAVLLGALWPLASSLYVDKKASGRVGILVSANTLGAGFASLLAGFALVPAFGFRLTTIFAMSFNILASYLLYRAGKSK